MAKNDTSYKFYFHRLHKSWRRDKTPSTVSYPEYTQDPSLCVVKTLDKYISRTEGCSSAEECSQLSLSFVNPHTSKAFHDFRQFKKCSEESRNRNRYFQGSFN